MDIKQALHSESGVDYRYHEWWEGSDQRGKCYLCYKVISGPAYVDLNESYVGISMHKTCAELPYEIQHPLHPHYPLRACWGTKYDGSTNCGFLCNGCADYSLCLAYRCDACDFKLDVPCASNLEIHQEAKIVEINEDFHDHKLQRFHHHNPQGSEDFVCSYCTKGFNGTGFACVLCSLLIHERCIHKIPRGKEIRSPFHLEHPLLLHIPVNQSSGVCWACNGFYGTTDLVLRCQECVDTHGFHLACGNVNTSGLRLKKYHEEHLLFYVYVHPTTFRKRKCVVCNTRCEDCYVYSCLDCDVFVHFECVPLPRVVKHPSHSYEDHVLTLSDSTNRQDFSWGKYNCIVCEEEGDLNHPLYHCKLCSDSAHIECILSEEDPPSEILEYLVPLEKCETDSIEEHLIFLEEESDEKQVDLQEFSLRDIDRRIAALRKKIDRITLQIELHEKARMKKIESSTSNYWLIQLVQEK